MKSVIYILIGFVLSQNIYAQKCDTVSYQSMYWADAYTSLSPQKIFVSNGNIVLAGISSPSNTSLPEGPEIMMMKLTERGTPLWCRNVGVSGSVFQNGDGLNDVIQTTDGSFVIAGYTQADNNASYDGWLAKLNADGTVNWTEIYDSRASRLYKVIELKDGSLVAIGINLTNFNHDGYGNITDVYNSEGYVVRVDKDGKKIWAKSFFSKQLNELHSINQTHDGNLVLTGETRGNGITDPWFRFIAKLDVNTGDFLWSNGIHYPEKGGFQPVIKEMPDGRLCIHDGSNISYFDSTGNALKNIFFTLSDNSWNDEFVQYIGSTAPGEDCYYAFRFRKGYLFKIKNDSSVMWAHSFAVQSLPGTLTEIRDAVFVNNAFYISAEINTQDDPAPGSRYYTYLIKTDANGNTPCGDTLASPFAFSYPSVSGNFSISFTNNGAPLFPLFRAMHSDNQVPYNRKDCFESTCCTDTLQYNNASVCEGTSYTLPNGNIVAAEGVYPTAFKTAKGCDSIIYTALSVQHPVSVSLGNDTCFANGNSLTYTLSYPQKVQYRWQDGSTDSVYTITHAGEYWVRVSSACNSKSDSVVVFNTCEFPVYVPGAFTPNNDGLNDVLKVLNLKNQSLINFSVYNRFGERIFFSRNAGQGWNGMVNGIMQPNGTYIYLVQYKDVSGRDHHINGTVVLIR